MYWCMNDLLDWVWIFRQFIAQKKSIVRLQGRNSYIDTIMSASSYRVDERKYRGLKEKFEKQVICDS